MPRNVPTILKDAAPFLVRADEVIKADPIISYWCMCCALLSFSHTQVNIMLRRLASKNRLATLKHRAFSCS